MSDRETATGGGRAEPGVGEDALSLAIEQLLDRAPHPLVPDRLVELLHWIQSEFGRVPEESTAVLADALNLSRADVWGVISFYHDFHVEPSAPAARISICDAEACRALGSEELLAEALRWQQRAGPDGAAVSVEPVYCLGCCATGPNVRLGQRVVGRVDTTLIVELLGALPDQP